MVLLGGPRPRSSRDRPRPFGQLLPALQVLQNRFDLSGAQPPDLEARRRVGAEGLGDGAAVELALPRIALAQIHRGARVLAVGLVVGDHESPVLAAVEQIDAARDEAERTR